MRLLYLDIDTLRADHLGCAGYQRDTTPNIDALATVGIRFADVPARAAGWWMVWEEHMVIEHEPSVSRDATRRRQLGIRNTLWTLWLRRPVRSAVRRTVAVLRSAPRAPPVTAGPPHAGGFLPR